MSGRANVLVGLCPVRDMSIGEVSGWGIVRSGKCPSGKCQSGNCPVGDLPAYQGTAHFSDFKICSHPILLPHFLSV